MPILSGFVVTQELTVIPVGSCLKVSEGQVITLPDFATVLNVGTQFFYTSLDAVAYVRKLLSKQQSSLRKRLEEVTEALRKVNQLHRSLVAETKLKVIEPVAQEEIQAA